METHRIELHDTVQDAIVKLADGNPGAIRAMVELSKLELGGLWPLLKLDQLGIYEPDIWEMYIYECKEDAAMMMEALTGMRR